MRWVSLATLVILAGGQSVRPAGPASQDSFARALSDLRKSGQARYGCGEEIEGLDARAADTDGDGLDDARDPLPLQPRGPAEEDDIPQLLLAVLPHLFGTPTPLQQTAATDEAACGLGGMHAQPSSTPSFPVVFVEGPATLPHAAGVRAIVLPPEALERYRAKFGVTYPIASPEIAFDPTRQRALIHYSSGWQGGSLLAERKDGSWTIKVLSAWIT